MIVGTLGLVRAITVRDVAGRLQASWHQDALAALHGLSEPELDLLVRLERDQPTTPRTEGRHAA